MDANTHELESVVERLEPIVQTLAARQFEPDVLETARRELRDVATVLEDGDAHDWSTAAQLLSDLIEIAACSLSGMDGADGARLTDCITDGVTLLRESLLTPDGPSEPLGTFVTSARDNWSDCLDVVDHADTEESRNDESGGRDTWATDSETQPSANDVNMILSTLGTSGKSSETTTPNSASADSVKKDLFDSTKSETAEVTPPPELAAVDDVQIEAELLSAFLADAEHCLTTMEQAVLEFESGGGEAAVQQLCRELHTLKGASASVGLTNLGSYLHRLEEWLEQVGTPRNLDCVLSCIDVIRGWVADQQHPQARNAADDSESQTAGTPKTQTTTRQAPPAAAMGGVGVDSDDSLRVKASQVDRLMDLLADLVMLRSQRDQRAARVGSIHEELKGCIDRLHTAANEAESIAHRVSASDPQNESDAHPLREGHLSEIAGDLTEVARRLKEVHDPLISDNRTISQFIRQFRHELMELRRMPVAGLFQRLQRAVRDAARVEQKQVRLEMVGEHAGLERSVQERLYEPLLHLVRNAVGHGIESEQERLAAGKDAVGTVTLQAQGNAQMLVLDIRDDGRGIDYEAVRHRGIERGLISADQRASRPQLAQLIFHPGFSTREEANEVAGRGVGMDVVASALRRMHARVDIDSEPGQGTTIRLRIPLRSVIEHTMVFRCSGQLFALPVQSVRAVSADEWQGSQNDSNRDKQTAKPIRLGEVLGLPPSAESDSDHYLVLGEANLPQTKHVDGNVHASPSTNETPSPHTVTVQVDEILGPDEVVVRSLPPLLRRHPLLSGATLSGSGDVVQLLDCDRLVEAGLATTLKSTQTTDAPQSPANPAASSDTLKVLVVDDSLSARRSLIQKLQPHEFELHEAGDGFEALDRIRNEHFDMVFSDLEMPRMGGFDLLAEVRSNRKTRSLPVVIVTTRGEREYRARAEELGTSGYMTKPVSAPELEQMLEQLRFASKTDKREGSQI